MQPGGASQGGCDASAGRPGGRDPVPTCPGVPGTPTWARATEPSPGSTLVSPAPEGLQYSPTRPSQAGLRPTPAGAGLRGHSAKGAQSWPSGRSPRSPTHRDCGRSAPQRQERDLADGQGWATPRGAGRGCRGAGVGRSSRSGPRASRQAEESPEPREQSEKRKPGARSRGRLGRPSRPVPTCQGRGRSLQSHWVGAPPRVGKPGQLTKSSQGRLRVGPRPHRRCKETQGLSGCRWVGGGGGWGHRLGRTAQPWGSRREEQEGASRGRRPQSAQAAQPPRGDRDGAVRLGTAVPGTEAGSPQRPKSAPWAWKEAPHQLSAINKTFIQTTAVQGTIQIKKEEGRQENSWSTSRLHTSVAALCLHSSTEHGAPGFEVLAKREHPHGRLFAHGPRSGFAFSLNTQRLRLELLLSQTPGHILGHRRAGGGLRQSTSDKGASTASRGAGGAPWQEGPGGLGPGSLLPRFRV